jgi:Hemerythrin HHE cation binding domain
MADALDTLVHDHAALNAQVLALSASLQRLDPAARSRGLEAALVELRDALFQHFAHEEEGLFPFVADAVPRLASQVKAMLIAHDTICGALSRMVYFAGTDAPALTLAPLFERFERAYVEHSQMELALLASLDGALDQTQRAGLNALVAAL